MSLPRARTLRMRLMAVVLCVLAFAIYATFAPTPSSADKPGGGSCDCGRCGMCSGHDQCVCLYSGNECIGAQWVLNSCNCGGC